MTTTLTAPATTSRPRSQLMLGATVLIFTMSTWFAASMRPVDGDGAAAGLLAAAVQLGFVAGAGGCALLALPDRVSPVRLLAGSAAGAALATLASAAWPESRGTDITLRLVTGAALAGVYPVALRIVASWFEHGRAFALAVLVGALTVGSAMPRLLVTPLSAHPRAAQTTAALLCLTGAGLALATMRLGPHARAAGPITRAAVTAALRDPRCRAAIGGYLGHMWELYALWAWSPALLTASLAAHGTSWSSTRVHLLSFVATGLCGAVGCLIGGRVGARTGPGRTAVAALLLSAACCLAAAAAFGCGPLVLVPLSCLWGAAAVADSPLFSTVLVAQADQRLVGSALAAQTAAGFALTIVTVQGLPLLVQAAGWRAATAALAVGPILGALAMRPLALGGSPLTTPTPTTASKEKP